MATQSLPRSLGLWLVGVAFFFLVEPVQAQSAPTSRGNDWFWTVSAEPFLFISDSPFLRAETIRRDLLQLQQQLQRELGCPPSNQTVRIYLFQDRKRYENVCRQSMPYLKPLDLQGRSAIFLMRDNKPYIFALRTDALLETLRHEWVHVMLNGGFGEMPIWLDEGLALFYQTGRKDGWEPRSAQSVQGLLQQGWIPNLKRLERLTSMQQLGPADYAEAWSWTYVLMNVLPQGRSFVRRYLLDVATSATPPSLVHRLAAHNHDVKGYWYRNFSRKQRASRFRLLFR